MTQPVGDGWFLDWCVGLGLIGGTIMLHALGLVLISLLLDGRLRRWESRRTQKGRSRLRRAILSATLFIGFAGWLLACLHGLDAAVWAAIYCLLGAIPSFHAAMLYSVDCMATLGSTGVAIAAEWSLLGPLEGACGMLLFGVSTAFLFTVMAHVRQTLLAADRAG